MTIDHGRSASPSGHSRAEPEEVSALRASVPNAALQDVKFALWQRLHESIFRLIPRGHCAESNWDAKVRKRESEPFMEAHLAVANALRDFDICAALASAIEARRAATEDTGAVHESAVGAAETPNTGRGTSHG